MDAKRIGVLVGSLRKASFSRRVAEGLVSVAPGDLAMEMLDIGDLPIFNQDFDEEGRTPQSWEAFRGRVGEMDGYLFVTPEYNRSVPPVLKNALDVASRPYGQNKWGGKPGGVVSVSTGGIGGFGANHHLRQSLAFLNVWTMQQPEAYIGNCERIFNPGGGIEESTLRFFAQVMEAFGEWVRRF